MKFRILKSNQILAGRVSIGAHSQITFEFVDMMNIPSFREGSQGSSSLVWSASSQSWLCGDSEGSILAKKVADAEHETTKLEGEPVTAIAVHPNKDECMVAEGDSISLRTLSSLDSLIQEGIIKSNLAFTHIQFDHSGHFL